MKRPLSKGETIRVVQAICDLNARLIGEEPGLVVSAPGKQWIRVNYKRGSGHRSSPKDYLGPEAAMKAAWTALSRARAIHEGRLDWDTFDIERFWEPLFSEGAVPA